MTQPNILIIHTDQQSLWTVSAYAKQNFLQTPHIDRLAKEGTRCDQFFTNSAVCTPSRGCFVSGRYPHANGAYTNCKPLARDQVTFAEVLRRNGYDTAYIGKWHLDGDPRPGWVHPSRGMGFTNNRYMFNRGHYMKVEQWPQVEDPTMFSYSEIGDQTSYMTDWLKDKTIEFLHDEKQNPFCLMVSIPDPHDPFKVRAPYDTMYAPDDMPIPDSFYDTNQASWSKPTNWTEKKLQQHKSQYCGMVKLIDDSLGEIFAVLEEKGIMDDTLIVFTADHGEYMGEHHLFSKNQMYETAYRVPMLMRLPGRVAQGHVSDQPWSTVDFQSTLLDLVGVSAHGTEQGRSVASALTQTDVESDGAAVQFHHSSHSLAGIATPQYWYAVSHTGEERLFDRVNDPDEMHDLSQDPAHQTEKYALLTHIKSHHEAVASPASEWLSAMAVPEGV